MIDREEIEIESIDLLSWLKFQSRYPKFYFKDECREIAACGNLLSFHSFPDLKQLPKSVKVLGYRQALSLVDQFYIPSLEIEKRKQKTIFSQNRASKQSNRLNPNLSVEKIKAKPVQVQYQHQTPDFYKWEEKVLKTIASPEVEKAVLSRKVRYKMKEFTSIFDIAYLLEKYRQNTSLYLFELRPQYGYVGATPETLLSIEENQLKVDALASTRKRGKDKADDLFLQSELFHSQKDLEEFEFVKRYVQKTCEPFCDRFSLSKPQILQTQDVQHIHSVLQGSLKQNISQVDLFNALHPTPAIVGYPKDKALKFLHETDVSRSFYSSSYGWASQLDTKFFVAIRGCHIEGKALELQSGVGIINQSDPKKEWQELDDKLYSFQNKIFHLI